MQNQLKMQRRAFSAGNPCRSIERRTFSAENQCRSIERQAKHAENACRYAFSIENA